MMSPCDAPWAWACDEQDAAKLLHCYLCPYLGHGHGPLWPGQGHLPPRLRLDQKENNPIKSKA